MRFMNPNGKSYTLSELQSPPMGGRNDEVNYYDSYEEKPQYKCIITRRGENIGQGNLCMYDIERTRRAGFSVQVMEHDPLFTGSFNVTHL